MAHRRPTTPTDAERMSEVEINRVDDIVQVELNRPDKMNALNHAMVEVLLQTVRSAAAKGVRALTLRGRGRNFSAGFDFGDLHKQSDAEIVYRLLRIEILLQEIWHAPFETVIYAHGPNFGAGADLVCTCSQRVAAPDATFRMPGLQFGVVLGARRLAERIGPDAARRILGSSAIIDAQWAAELGFIETICAPDRFEQICTALAENSTGIPASYRPALARAVVVDSRAQDLAELVRLATEPGLRDRMLAWTRRG
jgi:enoyl-CoA hydratase